MPDRRRYGRTPDTVCLLVALAVAGIALAVTGLVPISVAEIVPNYAGRAWAVTFGAAAVISLVGLYWHEDQEGWALELSGRIALAFTAAGYAIAIGAHMTHPGTLLVTAVVTAISIGSFCRIVQLVRRLSQFRDAVLAQKRKG